MQYTNPNNKSLNSKRNGVHCPLSSQMASQSQKYVLVVGSTIFGVNPTPSKHSVRRKGKSNSERVKRVGSFDDNERLFSPY